MLSLKDGKRRSEQVRPRAKRAGSKLVIVSLFGMGQQGIGGSRGEKRQTWKDRNAAAAGQGRRCGRALGSNTTPGKEPAAGPRTDTGRERPPQAARLGPERHVRRPDPAGPGPAGGSLRNNRAGAAGPRGRTRAERGDRGAPPGPAAGPQVACAQEPAAAPPPRTARAAVPQWKQPRPAGPPLATRPGLAGIGRGSAAAGPAQPCPAQGRLGAPRSTAGSSLPACPVAAAARNNSPAPPPSAAPRPRGKGRGGRAKGREGGARSSAGARARVPPPRWSRPTRLGSARPGGGRVPAAPPVRAPAASGAPGPAAHVTALLEGKDGGGRGRARCAGAGREGSGAGQSRGTPGRAGVEVRRWLTRTGSGTGSSAEPALAAEPGVSWVPSLESVAAVPRRLVAAAGPAVRLTGLPGPRGGRMEGGRPAPRVFP